MQLRSLIPLTLLLLIGGCASTPTSGGDNVLVGTAWKIVAIDPAGPDITFIDVPEHYLVQFLDATSVAMRADCNACNGHYNAEGRAIVMRIECETMACAPGSYSSAVLTLLNGVSTFRLTADHKHLFLNTNGERTVLDLEPVE